MPNEHDDRDASLELDNQLLRETLSPEGLVHIEPGTDPESEALSISRRGTPVLAVLSWDLYQSIIETLEILGDEQLTESVRQDIKEIEAGKGIPWDEARATLDQ